METTKNGLTITKTQIYPLKEGKSLARCRVELNGELQLTGLRIMQGEQSRFVAYPNDPNFKGEDYRQIFYPLTRELREMIESRLVREYEEAEQVK